MNNQDDLQPLFPQQAAPVSREPLDNPPTAQGEDITPTIIFFAQPFAGDEAE